MNLSTKDDGTPWATPPALLERLGRAIALANLGVPESWPLQRRAAYALRLLGDGGTVNLDAPWTVRRATAVLENAA